MRIILDGESVKAEDADTSQLAINYNADNTLNISQGIEFSGVAFEKIKAKIIDDVNPRSKTMSIVLIIDNGCCENTTVFVGELRGDTISFTHGGCSVSVNAIEKNEYTKKLKSLRTQTVRDVVTTANRFVGSIAQILPDQRMTPLVNINALIADWGAQNSVFTSDVRFRQENFKSMYMLHIPSEKPTKDTTVLDPENLPVWSMEEMLNNLAYMFNFKWFINRADNSLYFNRKDVVGGSALGYANIDSFEIDSFDCVSLSGKPYASMNLAYATDPLDDRSSARDTKIAFHKVISMTGGVANEWQDGIDNRTFAFAPVYRDNIFIQVTDYQYGLGSALKPRLEKPITSVPKIGIFEYIESGKPEMRCTESKYMWAENLYGNFHKIDNPNDHWRKFGFNITFTADCSFIANFNINRKLRYLDKILELSSATITPDTMEVRAQGFVVEY
jgi:hypothetical protein